MITILHGEDIATSRKQYKQLQQKDTIVFDGEKITIADLTQSLHTDGLFSETKHIAIENMLSKRKPSKELEAIVKLLNEQKEHTIVLWEGKELTKKILSSLPKADGRFFPLPQTLFAFLDAIKPNNSSMMLQKFHDAITSSEVGLVYFMIVRHVRMLLALSDGSQSDTIDEIKRMAPWQQKKLLSQSRQFSVKQLIDLHEKLYIIDKKQKSGGLTLPLRETIDFLLLSI